MQPRRLASLFAAALLRPRQAVALIALLLRTRKVRVVVSTSPAGQALRVYFDERALGLFPCNRLCRAVLVLPENHSEYLRGRRRQALRTNLRKAEALGIGCETISNPSDALDEITEIETYRRVRPAWAQLPLPPYWRTVLDGPEITLLIARDRLGHPLAAMAAVIDDAICVVRVAVASSHEARWALHDYLVRVLIGRGVSYLLVDGGGPFGALGFDANVQHYQRLLGYELRHVKPRVSRELAPTRAACPDRHGTTESGSPQRSAAFPELASHEKAVVQRN